MRDTVCFFRKDSVDLDYVHRQTPLPNTGMIAKSIYCVNYRKLGHSETFLVQENETRTVRDRCASMRSQQGAERRTLANVSAI